MRQDLAQASVTPLELFFDLVFVFALNPGNSVYG